MNKFLVLTVFGLVLCGGMVFADDFEQPWGGSTVDITVNDLDFEYIFGGASSSQGTIFTVDPEGAIAGLDLTISAIHGVVQTGTATLEYSLDESTWVVDESTFVDGGIGLVSGTPTLYVKLTGVSGTEDPAGMITYTITSGFVPQE